MSPLIQFFINDIILFIVTFLSNYADDNNSYNTATDLEIVKTIKDFRTVTDLFHESF